MTRQKALKKNLVCLLVHSDNLYHQLLKKYRKVTGINILRSQITNSRPTEQAERCRTLATLQTKKNMSDQIIFDVDGLIEAQ
ncbi:hypothetical protein, partial [Bacteroides intestinalis]|uniref:hypothetical protein n=1 Tax=Bacteroides intestinalis TaxID=329854 RepID=UPI0032EB3C81